MLFDGRFRRARESQRKQREAEAGELIDRAPGDEMEKGDLPAMLLAALVTIVPVCLLVMLALAVVGYFFIAR